MHSSWVDAWRSLGSGWICARLLVLRWREHSGEPYCCLPQRRARFRVSWTMTLVGRVRWDSCVCEVVCSLSRSIKRESQWRWARESSNALTSTAMFLKRRWCGARSFITTGKTFGVVNTILPLCLLKSSHWIDWLHNDANDEPNEVRRLKIMINHVWTITGPVSYRSGLSVLKIYHVNLALDQGLLWLCCRLLVEGYWTHQA